MEHNISVCEVSQYSTCATHGGLVIRVRLIRKLASRMNGVDVAKCQVGDILVLSEEQAASLIEAGWAEPMTDNPIDRPAPLDEPDIL